MRLLTSQPPPEVPAWLYVACPVAIAVCAYNAWVFRTGRLNTSRPEAIRFIARHGYAALPFLVSVISLSLALIVGPVAVEHQSGPLACVLLFLVLVSLASGAVGWREARSPSRWSKTPEWVKRARAPGEL